MDRVFLGWNGDLLARAAKWLVEQFEDDLSGVVVALPGARPGRILQASLAGEVGAGLKPPKVVTAGTLSDVLLEVEGASASRLLRTLAWERALRGLAEDELTQLVARPPDGEDRAAWAMLADEVRGLFGEIAAEGLDFAAVARSSLLETLPGEMQRWRALSKTQGRMAEMLADAGWQDPHLARLAAIEAGRGRSPRHVVLVGVVEMNELLRRALALCECAQSALVFAPEMEAASFDELGCLLVDTWAKREIPLDLEQWQVVDRPEDQARAVARVIASWHGEYRAEQISIGLADAEVSPFVKSRLAESGIRARDAAGTPMMRTATVRMLAAVAAFLRSGSYRDLSLLARHPDFEAAMLGTGLDVEPIDTLDRYHQAHLPWRGSGPWSVDQANPSDLALRARMNAVWEAACEVLAGLDAANVLSMEQQVAALRCFLERVYGGRELEAGNESDRMVIASLRCLGDGMVELENLPASLAPEGSIADSIDLLLRVAANKSNDVAQAGARAGEATIEMMGWLELPLDDVPALVVTGFQDGKVPQSVRGDAYLPNRLRRDLGLVDNQRRLARDLYATELLLHSRARVVFISGRRSLAGDPLVPSRVVFHCAENEVVPRVRRFLSGESARAARIESAYGAPRELPRVAEVETPKVISVSAFKTFLASPYAYYLQHVLKLQTLDDRAREMDGAAFGNLAHAVLQRFGQDKRARQEQDDEKIATFLIGTLRDLGAEIYGRQPLPAVYLQMQQLELRLREFARSQAKRYREGWRIHAVEWQPDGGAVDFVVDKEVILLKGRIDRIDFHETRRTWAIWDYKTGESLKHPLSAHRKRDGTWTDLQLPLYRFMTTDLCAGVRPEELGYIAIGRDHKSSGFWSVADWRKPKDECKDSDEAFSKGLEVARGIVRRIRDSDFFALDGWQPYDEIFAAIGGVGLVGLASEDQEGAQ